MKTRVTLMMSLLMGTMSASSSSRFSRYDECYRKVRRGLRLQASHVDKYVKAGSLKECERSCDIAYFSCKAFSYSDFHTREPENCLLSREDTYTLDTDDSKDFYQDADFAFYEKATGRDCQYEADHQYHNQYHSGVCYDLVKTRSHIDSRYVLKVLRTQDRQECEDECSRDRDCRGFNYRYKTYGYNQYRDNCELSSRDASNSLYFEVDDDFDFYEQITDSSKCRGSGSSGSNYYGGNGNNYGGNNYGGNNYGGNNYGGYGSRDECFRLAKTEAVMTSRLVRDSFEVRDIGECEEECTRSRYFTCRSFAFRYGHHSGRDRENCFLSDREYRDLSTYDLDQDRAFDFYERRLYDRECGETSGGYIDGIGDVTVSGKKCYRASCREDREGGYFYCHTDFSNAWDYCCRPREVCGYSQGYEQKWCFVGIEGRDQWRPCTDQGPGREFLKEEHPNFDNQALVPSFDNATDLQVLDLNDIA